MGALHFFLFPTSDYCSVALNRNAYISSVALKREEVPSFDKYPFSLPAVRALDRLELHPAVTFFVGENGSGKSTFLEAVAVACGFNAEGGSRNFQFGTRASHSELHRHLKLARNFPKPRDGFFLRAESFFNVATEIEKLDAEPANAPKIAQGYGERPLHEQSHGESFLALLVNRFHGRGLYMLDEPEAALSPSRQLSVLTRIHDLVELNSNSSLRPTRRFSWPTRTHISTRSAPQESNASNIMRPNIIGSRATFWRAPNGCCPCSWRGIELCQSDHSLKLRL